MYIIIIIIICSSQLMPIYGEKAKAGKQIQQKANHNLCQESSKHYLNTF